MKRIIAVYAALWVGCIALTVVACSGASAPTPTPMPQASHSQATGKHACHYRGSGLYALPDVSCTPGALNKDVTQATIKTTICKTGWTATVRPPSSYTGPLKRKQMALYGVIDATKYEEDHLVPLELGGAPADPNNLWPELDYTTPQANHYVHNPKDKLEFVLRNKVCAGKMDLQTAQQGIMSDWAMLYKAIGLKR
jgi:hypothetical protein